MQVPITGRALKIVAKGLQWCRLVYTSAQPCKTVLIGFIHVTLFYPKQ